MKKIVLVFIILLIGCRSFDDKGRLEKIRLQVPALINIEFDYYKDKENLGKEAVRSILTNSPPVAKWPKLMPLRKK